MFQLFQPIGGVSAIVSPTAKRIVRAAVPFEFEAFDADGVEIRVDQETFTGRFEMAPLDEITLGYEAQWNGACHTLVSPEWSVWIEEDDDDFIITVGRKIDDRAL